MIYSRVVKHILKRKIFSDQKLCGDFEYQNKECATFLETKPECTVFLNDPSYVKVKYLCSGIVISANKCSTLVHERLWYKWAFYFQDNVFLKNTLRWFNIDLDKNGMRYLPILI